MGALIMTVDIPRERGTVCHKHKKNPVIVGESMRDTIIGPLTSAIFTTKSNLGHSTVHSYELLPRSTKRQICQNFWMSSKICLTTYCSSVINDVVKYKTMYNEIEHTNISTSTTKVLHKGGGRGHRVSSPIRHSCSQQHIGWCDARDPRATFDVLLHVFDNLHYSDTDGFETL